MGAESVAVALVKGADRNGAARQLRRVGVRTAERFVARPVGPKLVVFESVVIEVAEGVAVQVPQVVHVDMVLDEQLPVARGRYVDRADQGELTGAVTSNVVR